MDSKIFIQYRALLAEVDGAFVKLRGEFPAEVRCGSGCVDCCSAFFDISLVEYLYLQDGLAAADVSGNVRSLAEKQAEAARLEIGVKLASLGGKSAEDKIEACSTWRIRCPLLGSGNTCILYPFRPVTCRVYGLPTAIGGQGHVCGFSGFDPGKTYPTIKLDQIFTYLSEFSRKLVESEGMAIELAAKRFFVYEVFGKHQIP